VIPEPLLRVAFVSIVIFLAAIVFLVILLFLVWLVPKKNIGGIEQSRSKYSGFIRFIPKWYAVIRVTAPSFASAVAGQRYNPN
jgi:hypothetical protein